MQDSKFKTTKDWFKNMARVTHCIRQNSEDHRASEKMLVGMVREIQEKTYLLE